MTFFLFLLFYRVRFFSKCTCYLQRYGLLFSPRVAVTRCIDTTFGTSSSLITTMCGRTSSIWKGSAFCGCSLLFLAIAISSDVLVLPVNGSLSTSTHQFGTNFGSKWNFGSQCHLYCTPHFLICELALACSATTLLWRFSLSHFGSVLI